MLSSFVSYFSLSESASTKGPTAEELEAGRHAQSCVQDCHLESLIADTKFLRYDSLSELVKVLPVLIYICFAGSVLVDVFIFNLSSLII